MEPIYERKPRALQTLQLSCLRRVRSVPATLWHMILFLAAITTVPFGLYYVSKTYLSEGLLGLPLIDSHYYSAIQYLVSFHVLLALFAYTAFKETTPQWQEARKLE